MSFVKKNFWHLLFLLVLTVVGVFLFIRNTDEDRWGEWSSVSEALMLRFWVRDGILEHKILPVVQGYSKVTRYYDSEPELNEHARSVVPRSDRFPGAGRLLRYTHYPSGYLIPYFILAKLGASDHRAFSQLSIIFSIAGGVLMYLFFCYLAGPKIASLAMIFYLTSHSFLSFTDCLSTPPFGDLVTYLFLLLVILERKYQYKRIWTALVWLTYLVLSLITLEIIFSFIFLVSWDLLNKRGFKIKRWFGFGLAFVAARIIYFAQVVWYLGFSRTIKDMVDSIYVHSASFGLSGGIPFGKALKGWWWNFERVAPAFPQGNIIQVILLIFTLGGLYYLYAQRSKIKTEFGYSYFWLLFILGLGGSIYVFVFPSAGSVAYQGRQLAPFFGLAVAFITWYVFYKIKKFRLARNKKELFSLFLFCPLFLMLWTGSIVESINHLNLNMWDFGFSKKEINFAKSLGLVTTGDRVVFMFSNYYPHDSPEHKRLSPIIEYYADASILPFVEQDNLLGDLKLLLEISEFPFSPILVTDTKKEMEEIIAGLVGANIVASKGEVVSEIKKIEDWEVVNLAPFLKMKNKI